MRHGDRGIRAPGHLSVSLRYGSYRKHPTATRAKHFEPSSPRRSGHGLGTKAREADGRAVEQQRGVGARRVRQRLAHLP
eukprot:6497546-Prymnesium_polylepis.1